MGEHDSSDVAAAAGIACQAGHWKGAFKMDFLNKLFGRKTRDGKRSGTSPETECVICSRCGASYLTDMILSSIMAKTPFMAGLETWSTTVPCMSCGNPIPITGSYNKVYGKPGPG